MTICRRYLITHKAVSEISILDRTTRSFEAFPPSLSLLDKWKFVRLVTVDPEFNKTLEPHLQGSSKFNGLLFSALLINFVFCMENDIFSVPAYFVFAFITFYVVPRIFRLIVEVEAAYNLEPVKRVTWERYQKGFAPEQRSCSALLCDFLT